MSAARNGIARRLATAGGMRLGVLTALAAALAIVAPAPANAAPAIQTVQLHIIDLKCLFQNDSFGSDEPYLLVNDVRVWSGSNVDNGDLEWVNVWAGFDEVIEIELWEDDGGLTGGDDHMATWYIWASEAGTGVHTVQSPWEKRPALYDLRYEVV